MSVSLIISRALSTLTAFMLLMAGNAHAVWEQPPFNLTFDFTTNSFALTSDQSGNAIVVSTDSSDILYALRYDSATNILYNSPIAGATASNGTFSLSGDQSGSALLVWVDANGTDLRSSFFNGTVWTVGSPDPFGTTDTNTITVHMNGPTTALATWNLGDTVLSAFFSAGSWTPTIPVVPVGFGPVSDYSANGTAAVIFNDGGPGGLLASNYIGGVWSTPVLLNPTDGADRNVGMDANGRAIAAWISGGTALASTFNGTSWGGPVVLSIDANDLQLKVAPGGTAVATWIDSFDVGYSSSYNGTTWGAPVQFGVLLNDSRLAIDDNGNALVIYSTQNDQIFSRRLPLGATSWGPQAFIGDDGGNFFLSSFVTTDSLSNNGFGFAIWGFGQEGVFYFLSVERDFLPPAPPLSIAITTCKNQFAAQSERVNFITWTPSPTFGVVAYNVRRNGVLVDVVLASEPLEFADHNRCKKSDVYTVSSVLANGLESLPITVSLQ